ncbi:MAG: hypothetical protein Q7U97_06425 [Rhodocyclaceae bacterium]|nr:hypothetical protein [Rhodocyclaceae bacterium]
MATPCSAEPTSIGLDDESWKALSCTEVTSLLRMLSFAGVEDRTYSNVAVFPPADGRFLYVKPH